MNNLSFICMIFYIECIFYSSTATGLECVWGRKTTNSGSFRCVCYLKYRGDSCNKEPSCPHICGYGDKRGDCVCECPLTYKGSLCREPHCPAIEGPFCELKGCTLPGYQEQCPYTCGLCQENYRPSCSEDPYCHKSPSGCIFYGIQPSAEMCKTLGVFGEDETKCSRESTSCSSCSHMKFRLECPIYCGLCPGQDVNTTTLATKHTEASSTVKLSTNDQTVAITPSTTGFIESTTTEITSTKDISSSSSTRTQSSSTAISSISPLMTTNVLLTVNKDLNIMSSNSTGKSRSFSTTPTFIKFSTTTVNHSSHHVPIISVAAGIVGVGLSLFLFYLLCKKSGKQNDLSRKHWYQNVFYLKNKKCVMQILPDQSQNISENNNNQASVVNINHPSNAPNVSNVRPHKSAATLPDMDGTNGSDNGDYVTIKQIEQSDLVNLSSTSIAAETASNYSLQTDISILSNDTDVAAVEPNILDDTIPTRYFEGNKAVYKLAKNFTDIDDKTYNHVTFNCERKSIDDTYSKLHMSNIFIKD